METLATIVAQNVGDLRRQRQLSVRELSAALAELGVRLLASAISKIENGQRKVTAEELVALAVALNVSPVRLLLPGESADKIELTPERASSWQAAWRWAVGEQPLRGPIPVTDPVVGEFIRENRPFEDRSSVREAARALVARTPVPFVATIRADAAGRTTSRLSFGSDDGEDGDDGSR